MTMINFCQQGAFMEEQLLISGKSKNAQLITAEIMQICFSMFRLLVVFQRLGFKRISYGNNANINRITKRSYNVIEKGLIPMRQGISVKFCFCRPALVFNFLQVVQVAHLSKPPTTKPAPLFPKPYLTSDLFQNIMLNFNQ